MRIKTEKHIADIEAWEYFVPMFNEAEEAKEFIDQAKKNPKTRIIVNQCSRMLFLADKVFQRGRPALDVLFLLIIAEATAKIVFDFTSEGKSKEYTHKFFKHLCNEVDRQKLCKAFKKQNSDEDFVGDNYLTLDETLDFLYKIRCDVVHRGKYFDNLYLKESCKEGNMLFIYKNVEYISPNISTDELRAVVINGVIACCRQAMEQDQGT